MSDLKAFLKRFGRSTSGRKQELLTRATEVVNERNSDVKTMAAFLRSIRPRTPRYTNFPHHVASLDPLTGLPSIPGFGSYPDLPLPPLEVNVPRMKANVAFCTSVYNQLDQHVLAPELLCECVHVVWVCGCTYVRECFISPPVGSGCVHRERPLQVCFLPDNTKRGAEKEGWRWSAQGPTEVKTV